MDSKDVQLLRELLIDRGQSLRSTEADFEADTWTFGIYRDTRVGAGDYLVISWKDFGEIFDAATKGAAPDASAARE